MRPQERDDKEAIGREHHLNYMTFNGVAVGVIEDHIRNVNVNTYGPCYYAPFYCINSPSYPSGEIFDSIQFNL